MAFFNLIEKAADIIGTSTKKELSNDIIIPIPDVSPPTTEEPTGALPIKTPTEDTLTSVPKSEYSTEFPDDYPFEGPVEDTTPVTQIKTPTEDTLTSVPTSTEPEGYQRFLNGEDLGDIGFMGRSAEEQALILNTSGQIIDFGTEQIESNYHQDYITHYKKSQGWDPSWKAHVDAEGKLVPLKEATNIGGTDNTATNRRTNVKGQAWHHYGTANRTEWSAEGYETPYDIMSDPNSNITRVRWVGDNSTTQKQESKDYRVNTAGANTDYKFSEHQKDLFLVHDDKAGWKIVSGAELTNPHHEVANPYNIETDEPTDPLAIYLRGQAIDPAIPASAQQTYQDIVTKPNEFLTETDKKIAEDLKISLQEAAKSKILLTSTGAYYNIDPDDIEGLKNLVASTYEDNVNLISDNQAGNAEAEAQLIEALTKSVTAAKSTGLTQEATAAARDTTTEQEAMADTQEGITADTITAAEGVAEQVEDIPTEVDSVTRTVDTIDQAAQGAATTIPDESVDAIFDEVVPTTTYEATTGAIRAGNAAAVSGSEQVGNAVREIAQGEAAIDTLEDPKVVAAIAEMPQEALVSSQLETLLDAIETDEIPVWARPAVEQVDKVLAQRGMGRSSVARDALFNAIITAATPIAQANAQALQTQALQNQANQQSANELQAKMKQDIRIANLSNRQTMEIENLRALNASQSEQFSFEAQQRLKEYETLVNFKVQNADYAQQMEMANLNDELQMELANLNHTNTANAANMTAQNQSRLLELQTYVDFVNKNADFKQQMELANLDMEGKVDFANLQSLNDANRDQMTADQQTALTEYQTKVDVGKYNAELAQQMGIANLNNKQQAAVQNAMNNLNIDMRKLELDQQVALANSQFLQTMTATDLSNRQQASILNATHMASLDMADLNNQQQAQVTNAQNFLKMDLTNVSNAQQAELFNDQWNQQVLLSNQAVENAAKQFASTSQNDINKFISSMEVNIEQNNAARNDTMEQFNAAEENKTTALNQANDQAVEIFNGQMRDSIAKYQEQINFQRESFNASMTHQIDSSNVTWRRNINTANTAGTNAVNQANAINAFNLSNDSMNKLWQEFRDQAQWEWQSNEQDATRKAQMALAVLGNESSAALAQMKIDADDATSVGEGIFNITNAIMSGEWSVDKVTSFFD